MDAFNVMESKFSSLNGNIQNIPFNITKFGNDISNSIASAEARMPNLVSGQPLPDQSYSDLLTSGLSCPKVTPIPGSKAQDQIMDTHSLIYCHLGVERQNIALDENQAALIDSQFNNLEASLTSDSEDLLLATLTSLASSLGELSNSISSDSYGYIPYVSDYVKINESKLSDLQLNIGGLLSKFKTFQNSSDLMLKGSEIKQKFGTATLALQGIFDTTSKIESLQAQNLTSYIKPKIVLISWVCVKNKVIKGFSGKVQKCPAGFRLKQ